MRKCDPVILRCSCGCGSVVFERYDFEGSFPTEYSISFQNSRMVSEHNSLFQRIRDATKILLRKPIYYSEVETENVDDMRKFLEESLAVINEGGSVTETTEEVRPFTVDEAVEILDKSFYVRDYDGIFWFAIATGVLLATILLLNVR